MGAPDEGEAEPSPDRSTSLGTSDSAAGSVAAMPMPWKMRATTNGPMGPPGSTPGSSRTAQPARSAKPPRHECAQATDPIDEHPRHEGGRDLDEGSDPDDDADLGVRHAGLCQRDRQRRGERVEAGLDREQGQRRVGAPAHHPRRRWEREVADPGAPGPGGSAVGGAGWSPAGHGTLAGASAPPRTATAPARIRRGRETAWTTAPPASGRTRQPVAIRARPACCLSVRPAIRLEVRMLRAIRAPRPAEVEPDPGRRRPSSARPSSTPGSVAPPGGADRRSFHHLQDRGIRERRTIGVEVAEQHDELRVELRPGVSLSSATPRRATSRAGTGGR